jgi:hypothetical protein
MSAQPTSTPPLDERITQVVYAVGNALDSATQLVAQLRHLVRSVSASRDAPVPTPSPEPDPARRVEPDDGSDVSLALDRMVAVLLSETDLLPHVDGSRFLRDVAHRLYAASRGWYYSDPRRGITDPGADDLALSDPGGFADLFGDRS